MQTDVSAAPGPVFENDRISNTLSLLTSVFEKKSTKVLCHSLSRLLLCGAHLHAGGASEKGGEGSQGGPQGLLRRLLALLHRLQMHQQCLPTPAQGFYPLLLLSVTKATVGHITPRHATDGGTVNIQKQM